MPVLETLRQALPELSKSERRAADYLLQYTQRYARSMTCDAIAAASGSSRSAVIRLCQKLGFRGYAEFRYALLNEPAAPVAQAQNTLQLYLDELQRLQPLAGFQTAGQPGRGHPARRPCAGAGQPAFRHVGPSRWPSG